MCYGYVRMIKILLFVYLAIFYLSCNSPQNTSASLNKDIYYFKDNRANLCFAVYGHPGWHDFSFTNVPCEKIPDNIIIK